MLADAQAGRTPVGPFAGFAGSLPPQGGLPERHRLLRELALQFRRRQSSRLQDAAARLQPDPLSAAAVLGVGADMEFHSTPAVVEIPAEDAHIRGIGTDH